jgi:signal transduction histidine kinase
MLPNNITPRVTNLRNYSISASQFSALTPPVMVQKKTGQFAAALAHEVRNPLCNINLSVELLQSMVNDDERKQYLDIIKRASERINDLLNDLLIYQKTAEVKPEENSVEQLLDEVLAGSKDRMLLKNITVRKYYTSSGCSILVDKQKVRIALTNIVINAIDAMPAENGQLKITVRSANGKCVVEIEDNGIGISKANLQNIFEPYFTKKVSGMGLGLSTTLETLSANHARVAVQSEEGRGTRFIISFSSMLQTGKYACDKPILVVA